MKDQSDSTWVVLGVPSAARYIVEIARNVSLVGLAACVVVWTIPFR